MTRNAGARFSLFAAICIACSCSSGTRVVKPTPTIVVLEAGAEPRQRLRYEPPPGLTEEVESSTKVRIANTFTNTTLETGRRSADFPTSIIRGRLHVAGRSPEGHALVSFAVEDVGTLEDVVDPRMRQLVDAQAHHFKNARSTWRLLPTGELVDVKVEMPNAPAAARTQISALSDAVDEMFVRFPEADIGVGAIWQIESQRTISSVTWTRKATYTLSELTDGQAIVHVSVAMRAPSQDLGVEPNATTTLKSGDGTASGQMFVPRRGLVVAGSSETTTEASFLIVRRRLRITSTLRTEVYSSVKRIDPAPPPEPPEPSQSVE